MLANLEITPEQFKRFLAEVPRATKLMGQDFSRGAELATLLDSWMARQSSPQEAAPPDPPQVNDAPHIWAYGFRGGGAIYCPWVNDAQARAALAGCTSLGRTDRPCTESELIDVFRASGLVVAGRV